VKKKTTKKSKLTLVSEKKIEFEIKHEVSVQDMIYKLQKEIEPKELLQLMGVIYSHKISTSYASDVEKEFEGYKLLLYIIHNWDKVLKSSEAYFKITQKNNAYEVCGTCADWNFCPSTEGWRIRSKCSKENGKQWKIHPKFKTISKKKLINLIESY